MHSMLCLMSNKILPLALEVFYVSIKLLAMFAMPQHIGIHIVRQILGIFSHGIEGAERIDYF